jgi:gas vesicle protein
MSEKESGSFAIGFVLGAVVGVAIGFLYAPKPGRETREMIKEKAEHAAEKAKDAAVKAEKTVEDKLKGK